MNPTVHPLLCATDLTPAAGNVLDRAARLAVQYQQPLHLVHVFDWPHHALHLAFGKEPLLQLRLQQHLHAALKAASAHIADQGLQADCELVDGKVASSIVDAATRRDAGLVVLGPHGESPLSSLLGSTAERVLLQGRLPVLVVRQPADAPYRHVLVATDFSAEANTALRTALALAPSSAFTVLTVYTPILEAHGKSSLAGDVDVARLNEQARQVVNEELADAVRKAREERPGLETRMMEGEPWRCIVQAAKEIGADLIVMGRRGQGRVKDTLLGSATRHVLSHGTTDVLVTPAD